MKGRAWYEYAGVATLGLLWAYIVWRLASG